MQPGTTDDLFTGHSIPESQFRGGDTGATREVPLLYAALFHGFDVLNWSSFQANASQMLAGDNNRELPDQLFKYIFSMLFKYHTHPAHEAERQSAFMRNILRPCTKLQSLDSKLYEWKGQTTLPGSRTCSFALVDLSDPGNDPGRIEVVGDVKTSQVPLGATLTPRWLKDNLALSVKDLVKTLVMEPFLQLLSSMLDSRKGLGFLTNYEETRFFKFDLTKKRIYMSPLVKCGQRLADHKPHILQAFLYMWKLPERANEFTRDSANALRSSMKKWLDQSLREEKEKEMGKRINSGSSAGSLRSKLEAVRHADVSQVFAYCEHVGHLGSGLTGCVEQYEYDGMQVAVKCGYPFNPHHDNENAFEHVKNEIDIYKLLIDLQGKVIPKVVASGYDTWFTAGGVMLITEKVGMGLVMRKDGMYVGASRLSVTETAEIQWKALQALEAIHAHDVVHLDIKLGNLRVEKVNGEFRVWWIDFGLGEESWCDEVKSIDEENFVEAFSDCLWCSGTVLSVEEASGSSED